MVTTGDDSECWMPVSVLVLYSLVILMAFLINPFLFFYYEEKQEEELISKVRDKNDGVERNLLFV